MLEFEIECVHSRSGQPCMTSLETNFIDMKRVIFCGCAAAAMAVGCMGPVELKSIWESNGSSTGSTEGSTTVQKALYITGVEYPEGTTWQSDAGSGVEGSKLFLMRDSVRIVELDIGSDYCVSSDADMHRVIDGHLYTDYSTDSETVIKIDGVEALRYSMRERIESMYVKDGNIYTLGVPRSGSGWNYRCNGVNLISRSSGSLLGGLYEDSGQVVFAFMESVSGSSEKRYFVARDGVVESVCSTESGTTVEDIMVIDSTFHYVATTSNGNYYIKGEESTSMEETSSKAAVDLKLYYGGKSVFIGGSLGSGSGVWDDNSLLCEIDGSILAMTVGKDSWFCVVSGSGLSIYCDDEGLEVPQGYNFIYTRCICNNGTQCYVGLNRTADNMPALWIDWQVTDYNFNGIITGVWYQ